MIGRHWAVAALTLIACTRDRATTAGRAGTAFFVPRGPFSPQPGTAGWFVLGQLPAGTLSVTFFRDGYEVQSVDGLVLGSGQDVTLRDLVLKPTKSAPRPGAIDGTAFFTPTITDASAATVSAFPSSGEPLTAH